MNREVTTRMLREMDIFEFLDEKDLERIVPLASVEEFKPGDIIFKEGDEAEKIYMVLEGRVSIEILVHGGKMIPVYTMMKGTFFGYPSLLRNKRYTTFARCLDRVKVVTIPAKELEKIFEQDSNLAYLVMKRVAELIAQKLANTRMQLISCIF